MVSFVRVALRKRSTDGETESYLRKRADAKFDRNDFDCLTNKFLSRLVIRAN